MEVAVLLAAVAGATELVKRLFRKDYEAAVIITVAAVLGGVFAATTAIGLAVWQGVAVGLGASGVVSTAAKVGGKS